MKNLMNIDSGKLLSDTLQGAKVGDIVHAKGRFITGFGRTMEVIKVTPKRVKCKVLNLWFPVFKNTAFGRVAKGEDKECIEWLKDVEKANKGKVFEFTNLGIGWGNDLNIVEVID